MTSKLCNTLAIQWQRALCYLTEKMATASTVAIMMLIAVAAPDVQAQQSEQAVGLVLSGGGAKGIAHIGVIQALEDNDIPIDYITGTSMGAIVGGLYAAGYTPQEMMDLILSRGFGYWSTGQIDPKLSFYFSADEASPSMLTIPISSKADKLAQDTTAVPASLISPLPMSFAFMQLFAGYNAQCGSDFNKLFVPFRCCASDAAAHHRVVLSKGDFGDAIRSSMSFPIVFQPTEFEGMLLYDGGIYDNFPADVMNADFAPDFVLGVDVSTEDTGPQTSLMDQIENLVMQHSSYYLDPSNGIKLKINLNEFSLLDFPQAKAIYKIGYDHAMAMMDSIKGRIHTRTPKEYRQLRRDVFKSQTPYVRFDKVEVTGATPRQCRYIEGMFRYAGADTFGIKEAQRGYYHAISTGKLRDLQPHAIYNDSTGLYRLTMRASVKDNCNVGVGGYVTSSTTSYVYLSGGYSTFSYNSLSTKVSAWLGQSYLAGMLTANMYLPTRFTSALGVQAVISRRSFFHTDKLFYSADDPSFVRKREIFGRLRWAFAPTSLSRMSIGIGIGNIYDSFYQPPTQDVYNPYRDHCHFDLAQAYAKYESSTLNDINFPTMGAYYNITAMGVMSKYVQKEGSNGTEKYRTHPRWVQIESVTRNYFNTSRHFSIGVESDIMLSTRHLLPDYNISIVAAPGYNPTPSSNNSFNAAFRANSFVAAGVTPIYKYNENLSARLSLNGFMPIRKILDSDTHAVYDKRWLSVPEFYGEFNVCYKLPFATVTGYCSYTSKPAHNWNIGIAFGVYMLAPQFLR